jgi:RNA polymerase sigma-70 factor, ECF subfamily
MTVETASDEKLMLEFQRGSPAAKDAFEELFARYRGPLFGFFRRRLATETRAEDLVQETFLAVVRAIRHYEPRSTVRTYLYGIAMNLALAERRKQAKEREPGTTMGESNDESADESAFDQATVASEPETLLWVRQALEKLDAVDREVLMLREYEQLSYTEIAQLLRIPVNTVRSRLFRARMALRERLHPEAESKSKNSVVAIRSEGKAKASTAESEG